MISAFGISLMMLVDFLLVEFILVENKGSNKLRDSQSIQKPAKPMVPAISKHIAGSTTFAVESYRVI